MGCRVSVQHLGNIDQPVGAAGADEVFIAQAVEVVALGASEVPGREHGVGRVDHSALHHRERRGDVRARGRHASALLAYGTADAPGSPRAKPSASSAISWPVPANTPGSGTARFGVDIVRGAKVDINGSTFGKNGNGESHALHARLVADASPVVHKRRRPDPAGRPLAARRAVARGHPGDRSRALHGLSSLRFVNCATPRYPTRQSLPWPRPSRRPRSGAECSRRVAGHMTANALSRPGWRRMRPAMEPSGPISGSASEYPIGGEPAWVC